MTNVTGKDTIGTFEYKYNRVVKLVTGFLLPFTCIELLTQHMRHSSKLDQSAFWDFLWAIRERTGSLNIIARIHVWNIELTYVGMEHSVNVCGA